MRPSDHPNLTLFHHHVQQYYRSELLIVRASDRRIICILYKAFLTCSLFSPLKHPTIRYGKLEYGTKLSLCIFSLN